LPIIAGTIHLPPFLFAYYGVPPVTAGKEWQASRHEAAMHIDCLRLQRFRSCADVTVRFHPELTVLVGENNGGKSNIVDALRLLTLPLSGRRDRYPESLTEKAVSDFSGL
jgi:AAA ATPase-like protein